MYYNFIHILLTYSMVQSPSWEANWFAASQIPHISRNLKVHYCTHKRPLSRTWVFLNKDFYSEGLLAPWPTPQAGGPPLVSCLWLLIQFICSYPPYRRLFLYLHPEDAPCHGDKDPFIYYSYIFIMLRNVLTLLGLKYVAYYTQFSQQKAWFYKTKLSWTKQIRNKPPSYCLFTAAVSCSQTMEGIETGEVY